MKRVPVQRLGPALRNFYPFNEYPVCIECGMHVASGEERLAEIRAGLAEGVCHICEPGDHNRFKRPDEVEIQKR